ncbi:MAG TPA: hypothetical protein VKR53_11550 [Puia sp.]|nr:hypothetical protein [Puia sp.]
MNVFDFYDLFDYAAWRTQSMPGTHTEKMKCLAMLQYNGTRRPMNETAMADSDGKPCVRRKVAEKKPNAIQKD